MSRSLELNYWSCEYIIQTRTLVERRRDGTIEMKWDRGTPDANARVLNVLNTQTAERCTMDAFLGW